jgi:hypothetical protein
MVERRHSSQLTLEGKCSSSATANCTKWCLLCVLSIGITGMATFATWLHFSIEDVELRSAGNLHAIFGQDLLNVTEKFSTLVEETLAPWLPFPGNEDKLLHTEMFETLDRTGYRSGARVRIFKGRVFFRQVMRWKQPFYYARLRFQLNIIHEAVVKAQIQDTELFIGVSDGPSVSFDTSAPIHGLPIFSGMTSPAHSDILVPQPFEMGAYKYRYQFKSAPPFIPWENKSSALYFRGKLTSFGSDGSRSYNWNLSPRVRAAKLSQRNSTLFNMHLTGWGYGAVDEFKADSKIKLAPQAPLEDQCSYKWNLNLNGALGSTRVSSIVRCGSLIVQPRSVWATFSLKLLVENVHYVAVDSNLRSLSTVVDWLYNNDEKARDMANAAWRMGNALFTRDAALHYWMLLLRRWAQLFRPGLDFTPRDSDWDHCSEPGEDQQQLRGGAHNCSKGWLEFTSLEAFDLLYKGLPIEI